MKKTYAESASSAKERDLVLTSTQAASLLQVHESSIKRWSNQGELAFSKTSGGHRRFSIDDLLSFVEKKGQEYPFSQFESLQQYLCEALVKTWHDNHLGAMRALLSQWLQSPLRQKYPNIFRVLYRDYDVTFSQMFDELLCGLMADVGIAWQEGQLPVGEEHLISQIMMSGLQGLLDEVRRKHKGEGENRALLAISAGAEGSHHELGAFGARLQLEEHGWRTLYPGANLPTSELAMMQRDYGARLVCVSFVKPLRLSDLHRCLDTLKAMYDETQPYVLVVGGSALNELGHEHHVVEPWFQNSEPFEALVRLTSLKGFDRWLKEYAENADNGGEK